MIEVFKIVHNVYDNAVAPLLSYYNAFDLQSKLFIKLTPAV